MRLPLMAMTQLFLSFASTRGLDRFCSMNVFNGRPSTHSIFSRGNDFPRTRIPLSWYSKVTKYRSHLHFLSWSDIFA